MHNIEIRNAIKSARVYGYEIAQQLGITESTFSKRLTRRELTDDEKKTIYTIINRITKGESR